MARCLSCVRQLLTPAEPVDLYSNAVNSQEKLMAQTARKTAIRSREDAISLLKSDHEEVSELFEKYEKGVERSTAQQKTALAQ